MLANTFFTDIEINSRDSRDLLESLPVIERCMHGEAEMQTYIAFLTEAYHHVKHTVPLLMACGSRLPERLEWLREAVAEYIDEEIGHQEWILNDLAALGADSEMVRHGQPTLPTELMVSYAYDTVMRNNPVGFFGMVYVLEKTSSTIATHAASQIASALSLSPQSMTYLVSHGSLDIKHMETFEQLMNRLDCDEDRQSVLHSARVFYELYSNIFRSLPLTH
jgi:pyrroloquinoline quinone (PQQ) biosynthesis protein C